MGHHPSGRGSRSGQGLSQGEPPNAATDTIAAIATPPGRGGVGVIRISGPDIPRLMLPLLGQSLTPRFAHYRPFLTADGSRLDQGIALYFRAPHSYTGEDVLELHAHGNTVLLDMLLRRILECGVRLARPGEFTERAFLNGRMDLAQAEAVADLINSSSEQAVRSAGRSLQGDFSRQIDTLLQQLTHLRLYVESSIDFVDEEIDFLEQGGIARQLTALIHTLTSIRHAARQGCLLREGMSVVIAGCPNVGKSSLINRLSGRETAIVTDTAGTTRDPLREYIQIDGMPLHIIDTAGIRHSHDRVEQEGIRRAWTEIGQADRILWMMDIGNPASADDLTEPFPPHIPVTRLLNKIDRTGQPSALRITEGGVEIALSVKTGEGLDLLRTHLKQVMGYQADAQGVYLARTRHLDALERTAHHLTAAQSHLTTRTTELLAEELRLAQNALAEITGSFTPEDLLDQIFSQFCIGK